MKGIIIIIIKLQRHAPNEQRGSSVRVQFYISQVTPSIDLSKGAYDHRNAHGVRKRKVLAILIWFGGIFISVNPDQTIIIPGCRKLRKKRKKTMLPVGS